MAWPPLGGTAALIADWGSEVGAVSRSSSDSGEASEGSALGSESAAAQTAGEDAHERSNGADIGCAAGIPESGPGHPYLLCLSLPHNAALPRKDQGGLQPGDLVRISVTGVPARHLKSSAFAVQARDNTGPHLLAQACCLKQQCEHMK